MAKAKYKIGMYVETTDGQFGPLTGVIHRSDKSAYEIGNQVFQEEEIKMAYRPVSKKSRTTKKTKPEARAEA